MDTRFLGLSVFLGLIVLISLLAGETHNFLSFNFPPFVVTRKEQPRRYWFSIAFMSVFLAGALVAAFA
jgi:hypothetical protein